MHTATQKFGISKIFYVFLRESLLLIKAVFILSTNINIVKYRFPNLIYLRI